MQHAALTLLLAGVAAASYFSDPPTSTGLHETAAAPESSFSSPTSPPASAAPETVAAAVPSAATAVAPEGTEPPDARPAAAAQPESPAKETSGSSTNAAPAGLPEPVETAAAPAPVSPARDQPKSLPSFRDERALKPAVGVLTTPAAAAQPATPIAVTAPQDGRTIAAPSFRDLRPTAPSTFRDDRPVAIPVKEDEKKPEPKPFEVGYFLDDRSPMVRSLQSTPEDEKASTEPVAEKTVTAAPTAPPATAPADTVPVAETPSPPAAGSALPTLVALAPGSLKIDGTACAAPDVTTEPEDGGMMRMRVTANCRPNEFVQISYGGAEFIRKLSNYGTLDFLLDAFAGTSSAVEVRFADGTTKSLHVVANDLDKVSKIAVTWRTGVNLDLHVFEYAASFDQPGHLWARTPSAMITAKVQAQAHGRGHGFLSSVDDDKSLGDKLEVYTFFHNDLQNAGAISLALDNETRGESPTGATCGQGALAEIDFQVSILPRNGQVSRQSGVLTRVECGTRLSAEARFNQAAMPGLRIKR